MQTKWTAERIKELKGTGKITCLTAYDYTTAKLIDAAGIHLALVGDSLANTMLGHPTTLAVTMEQMLHHTAAVSHGVTNALVVADMPFMSYQVSTEKALENAGRFLKEAGAGAVKIEGGAFRSQTVAVLVANGIPVLGHIGLTPQSIRQTGYKVRGRKTSEAESLVLDAKALEAAGVFGIVIECVPAALSKDITKAVRIPTIGIGAGPDCDGQILVTHDLLGLSGHATPKFVKRYAELGDLMVQAFKEYKAEVESGSFPSGEYGY